MSEAAAIRTARCGCGAVSVTCRGEPVRVSVCHCLDCQRRSGSVFAAQARFPADDVTVAGDTRMFERVGDSGRRALQRFCPTCGSTVCYQLEDQLDLVAVPVGLFADPGFPAPRFSVWEERRHAWVSIAGEKVDHQR